MEPWNTPTPEDVYAELDRVLNSSSFASAHRGQQFLRYIVDHSLGDTNGTLKEYVIAVDVFERNASYDPNIDATVRVEAGRLRSRLREYYAGPGRNDPVIIDIPKGGYRATFTERAIEAPPKSETRPATSNRGVRWILAAALLIVAVAGILLFRALRHPKPTPATKGRIVLAVLPFTNQTGSDDNTYLSDSLTDNLTRQLSDLPVLEVISRDAAERVDPRTAWSELHIGALLSGKLQRNPDGQLVLNAELSNAKNGTILHSSQYLPDGADFQPVQSEIVQDVIRGLGIELDSHESANAQRPLTSSALAFQAFLRGESAMRHPNADSLHVAIHDFEEAVKQDPSFALAYASLAEAHLLLGMYFEAPTEHMPQARTYAQKALDPSIYEAHGTLGLIHLVYDWDYAAAQNELAAGNRKESAIWSLACTVHLLMESGDTRRAEEDLHRMMEFDPRSPTLVGELGCVKYYGGHYDDSVRYYRQAITDDPQSPVAYWGLGRSLAREGRYAEALRTLKEFKAANGFEPPVLTAEIGYSQAASGNRRAALETEKQLESESRQTYVDPFFMAMVYLGLEDSEKTYEWLDNAFEKRSPFLISIASDPRWAALRGDSRFQSLWNRMTTRMSATSIPPKAGNRVPFARTAQKLGNSK